MKVTLVNNFNLRLRKEMEFKVIPHAGDVLLDEEKLFDTLYIDGGTSDIWEVVEARFIIKQKEQEIELYIINLE